MCSRSIRGTVASVGAQVANGRLRPAAGGRTVRSTRCCVTDLLRTAGRSSDGLATALLLAP
jgi:hypothetical protein